jgi:hypothetical protein
VEIFMKSRWKSFMEQAGPVITGRGLSYFEDGLVDDLEEIEAGYWTAVVNGSERYDVTVQITDDQISEWACDCPYDGYICKHVIAVVFGIEQALPWRDINEPGTENTTPPAKNSKLQLLKPDGSRVERILARVSDARLRDFIRETVRTEPALKNLLIARFADLLEDDPEKKYRTILTSTLMSATNRYDYIDDHSMIRVERVISGLTATAGELFGRGNDEEGLLIYRIIIEELSKACDTGGDPEGSLYDMLYDVISELKHVARSVSEVLRSQLFNWCMAELGTPRYRYMGLGDDLIGMLPQLVTGAGQEEIFLRYINNGLNQARANRNNSSAIFDHPGERALLAALLDYYDSTGQDEEVLKLLETNIHIPAFRLQLINNAIGAREFDKARELCFVASAGTDSGTGNRVSRMHSFIYRDQLLQIARLTGDTAGIRTWSLDLFLSGWNYANTYNEYKSAWTGDEWKTACEDLITLIQKNIWKSPDGRFIISPDEKLGHIYIQEGFWPQLMMLARKYQHDPRQFDHWKPHLIRHYPEQVIEILENAIRMRALQTGRDNYRAIANRLREINDLPGGDVRAHALLNELLERHKNRPAMREEFRKAFPGWVG